MFDFATSNWQATPLCHHGADLVSHAGDAHIISGFVHPPTEIMFQVAFMRGNTCFTTVKGLEGCDLPRERTAIIGMSSPNTPHKTLIALGTLASGTT